MDGHTLCSKRHMLCSAQHTLHALCVWCMQIPLLPLEDKVVNRQQEEMTARAVVSPNDLPSCCFFTLINTRHGGVTALTSSFDSKQLAGAYLANCLTSS